MARRLLALLLRVVGLPLRRAPGSVHRRQHAAGTRGSLARTARGKRLLAVAVAANLALLGYFKYADFFIDSVNRAVGAQLPLLHVVLPLGISFFTFTQIAFLVDAWRGLVAEYRFVHYTLFVTYFPHLIAGPILHHKEMMPQFDGAKLRAAIPQHRGGPQHFRHRAREEGAARRQPRAVRERGIRRPGGSVAATAWGGVLAYSFQLYFDFSGYSDMAIGCRGCSASGFPSISTARTRRRTFRISGGAGT